MKVLKQDWKQPHGPELISLSKNQKALKNTIQEIANSEEPAFPDGEPDIITISNKSEFAEMVGSRGTVFLHEDELGIVFDAPEYK